MFFSSNLKVLHNLKFYFIYFSFYSRSCLKFSKNFLNFSLKQNNIFLNISSILFCNLIFYFPKMFHNIFVINFKSFVIEPFISTFLQVSFLFKYSELFLFQSCVDITASDFLIYSRFVIFYNLLSVIRRTRLLLRVPTFLQHKTISSLPHAIFSISYLFPGAVWLEREIWDMFGIFFFNNLDLRRILTDYGFKGFPLRKDFPVVGFVEIFFNFTTQNLTYTALELVQSFRLFLHETPWTTFK